MTLEPTTLYDFAEKNAIRLQREGNNLYRNNRPDDGLAFYRRSWQFMNTVQDIEGGTKENKEHLPFAEIKDGYVRISSWKRCTLEAKKLFDLSRFDLRFKEEKIRAIILIANEMFSRWRKDFGGVSCEEMDLIVNLAYCKAEELEALIK